MHFPTVNPVQPKSETANAFTGYNHTINCVEGSYYDMKNITSDYFPTLSPRKQRAKSHVCTNFLGMLESDGIVHVDDGVVYHNGEAITGKTLDKTSFKQIVKMGGYLCFFPDKAYYDTTASAWKEIDNYQSKNESVSFTLTREDGTAITWHDAAYYENHDPQNGDYKMETVDGTTSLSVYSSYTSLWSPVATTYMKIAGHGVGTGFKKGDGAKISVYLTGITWDYAPNIFVNDEGSGWRSNNFVLADVGTDYVIVPALLNENKTFLMAIKLERTAPDMAFVIECQNRLWGCSTDGHEIYCSKLGDPTNWNVFQGIATDSWAATIGSDGVFTGAINFQGYPLFFKEDSIIRVSVSSIGAHSLKETKARGVANGSAMSLKQVNEVLFYKSTNAICMYDGSFPTEISSNLGEIRYIEGVAEGFNGKYYICLYGEDEHGTLFVYDTKYGFWVKEDKVDVEQLCKVKDFLYMVVGQNVYELTGRDVNEELGMEAPVSWAIESGNIGYHYTSKKHSNRINEKFYLQKILVNARLEHESQISVWVNYDSSDEWEFLWNISGTGTGLKVIPIRPNRCDHFRYRLVGRGDAKIFNITKDYIEGSDV